MTSKARQLGEYSEVVPWISTAVGYSKSLFITNTALYPPTDNPLFRYVILTEGQDGIGGYNEGLLINETITGTGVERQATAQISLAGSPLNGAVVHLINSERSHLRPGETAGVFEQDQMQRITGLIGDSNNKGFLSGVENSQKLPSEGALDSEINAIGTRTTGSVHNYNANILFDSANSPSARTSATTDGATEVKSVSNIVFLRVA